MGDGEHITLRPSGSKRSLASSRPGTRAWGWWGCPALALLTARPSCCSLGSSALRGEPESATGPAGILLNRTGTDKNMGCVEAALPGVLPRSPFPGPAVAQGNGAGCKACHLPPIPSFQLCAGCVLGASSSEPHQKLLRTVLLSPGTQEAPGAQNG